MRRSSRANAIPVCGERGKMEKSVTVHHGKKKRTGRGLGTSLGTALRRYADRWIADAGALKEEPIYLRKNYIGRF